MKAYLVKLTRLGSTHRNLRTDDVTGICSALPRAGEEFHMIGEGLSVGTTRYIRTTPVVEMCRQEDGSFTLVTHNSMYSLRILDQKDVPSMDLT